MKAILHCSDSPAFRGDSAETIHKWHLERGWDGIGYHYVIREDGTLENGRPTYWTGSHCKGHNDDIGICLIGDKDFTIQQFNTLCILLNKLEVDKDDLKGHYELDSSKTCPNMDMDAFKQTFFNIKDLKWTGMTI